MDKDIETKANPSDKAPKPATEETEIVPTDPNELYENEEEILEPDVTPPGSSRNLWIIVALVVLIIALAGGIGYYYYNHSAAKANKEAADLAYTNNLTTYYNEYIQAQEDYFTALNDQFSSYKDADKHVFTDADVKAIKGATDMFEQRGTAALDSMIAIEAPRDKADAQKEVIAAAKEVKKTVLPASLEAQRAIKKGETLQGFVEESEAVFAEKNTEVEAAFKAFRDALTNAGVDMSTEQSGS